MYRYIYIIFFPTSTTFVGALAPGGPVLMGVRPCLASAATTQAPRAKAPHAPMPAWGCYDSSLQLEEVYPQPLRMHPQRDVQAWPWLTSELHSMSKCSGLGDDLWTICHLWYGNLSSVIYQPYQKTPKDMNPTSNSTSMVRSLSHW